jgi:hypothetical protein
MREKAVRERIYATLAIRRSDVKMLAIQGHPD